MVISPFKAVLLQMIGFFLQQTRVTAHMYNAISISSSYSVGNSRLCYTTHSDLQLKLWFRGQTFKSGLRSTELFREALATVSLIFRYLFVRRTKSFRHKLSRKLVISGPFKSVGVFFEKATVYLGLLCGTRPISMNIEFLCRVVM